MKTNRIITLILGMVMVISGVYCLFTPAITYMTIGYDKSISDIHLINSTDGRMR
ncbi:hypothetical protein QYZ88_005415 [Lachnospiraceae bacterium C1.1]|nr:hypothetical protein [Lachnospiraceae bacterium C1.1]